MKGKELKIADLGKYLLLLIIVLSFVFVLFFASVNLENPKAINIALALPFVIFLGPYLFINLYGIRMIEMKMQVVPRFLRDVVDNVESGMDLVSSIKNTQNNEYTVLNADIKKLVNQLSWGVNLDDALMYFAKNVKSETLQRDFELIIEARSIGGHVEKILRELSQKISIDNLRNNERKSNLSSNTFTGYISFAIFLLIIVLVYNNLFVNMASSAGEAPADPSDNAQMSIYLTLLMLLSYELALLSGFLFGLMQENNIINGAPHVVALVVMTFSAFFFFI